MKQERATEYQFLPYWHAKPRKVDAMLVFLLVPALIWVCGFIVLTGPVHVTASRLDEYDQQMLGSWLMVVGGEIGTLATSAEVFRKQREGEARALDWIGLAISLVASLATGLSIFVKQTAETWTWVLRLRPLLPLALRGASVLDFYSNAMELGFYITHYGDRLQAWEEGKHNHLMRERKRYQEWQAQQSRKGQGDTAQVAQPGVEIVPLVAREEERFAPAVAQAAPKEISLAQFRKRLAEMPDTVLHDIAARIEDPEQSRADVINGLLAEGGFAQQKPSTARYWAGAALEIAQSRNGGSE